MNLLLVIGLLTALCLPAIVSATRPKCRLQQLKDQRRKIDPKKEMCAYLPFQGSVGKIIAELKPTIMADATTDHAEYIYSCMKKLVGLIPVAGSYITKAYELSSKYLNEPTDGIVARIVKELELQIKALKNYVDAKIQEVEYKRLTQHLAGLLAGGRACADYDKADQIIDLERCLISLNTRVVGFVKRFLPTDDSILPYDFALFLFRQYCDLQLTVTQDLLRIAMRLKKNSAAEDYAKRLRDQSKSFYSFSKKTVSKIIKSHSAFKKPKCTIFKSYEHSVHQIIHGKCTQELYQGRVCTEEAKIGWPVGGDYKPSYNEAYYLSHTCFKAQVKSIKKQLLKDLNKYWDLELMDAAKKWYKVGKKADELYKDLKTF